MVVDACPQELGDRHEWRLHDFRHWSATVSTGQGHEVRTVAGRLGHSNPAMTLRAYVHASTPSQSSVMGASECGRSVDMWVESVQPVVVPSHDHMGYHMVMARREVLVQLDDDLVEQLDTL
ncbi:MAG: hypothetical protein ACI91Q_000892, partial [Gammaproteobacteria bacterium]